MDRIEFYRDKQGQHRWRYICGDNGQDMGGPQQGYSRLVDCKAAAARIVGREFVDHDYDLEDAKTQILAVQVKS